MSATPQAGGAAAGGAHKTTPHAADSPVVASGTVGEDRLVAGRQAVKDAALAFLTMIRPPR
jgi:hypothetical protein